KGVLVPLLVRALPNGNAPSFLYEVVAGARRFRAAKAAGLVEVPCEIKTLNDKEVLEIQLIENSQRADVHPLEEAQAYRQLLEKHGYDVQALAIRVGKSESYVYARLKLSDLNKRAADAFLAEKITATHALLIARLQPKDQVQAIEYCLGQSGVGYHEDVETAVKLRLWI